MHKLYIAVSKSSSGKLPLRLGYANIPRHDGFRLTLIFIRVRLALLAPALEVPLYRVVVDHRIAVAAYFTRLQEVGR